MQYDPGYFDHDQKTLQTLGNPFDTRSLPMSKEQTVIDVSCCTKIEVAERVGFSTIYALRFEQDIDKSTKNAATDFELLSWGTKTGTFIGTFASE
jgi:hypothetical protein